MKVKKRERVGKEEEEKKKKSGASDSWTLRVYKASSGFCSTSYSCDLHLCVVTPVPVFSFAFLFAFWADCVSGVWRDLILER